MTAKPQKRLPLPADFKPGTVVAVVPPPQGQPPTNILVLLHGLGDTHAPFERLGQQLQLPNTACLAVRAHTTLPFEQDSFHWGDDIIFDSTTNTLDPDGGFNLSTTSVLDLVKEVIIDKCHYRPRDVVFFGLGQGGMVALNVALSLDKELGGVISIGGPLPAAAPASSSTKSKTPVIVCSGRDSPWLTSGALDKIKRNFQVVQHSEYKRKGDTMPRDREEMMPIMRFFASRLRTPAPKGAVEVT